MKKLFYLCAAAAVLVFSCGKDETSSKGGGGQRPAPPDTTAVTPPDTTGRPDPDPFPEKLPSPGRIPIVAWHGVRASQVSVARFREAAELGITVVFVTHDQEEAFAMSDRVVVINQGRIEQIGTPQEIYEEPSNLYVARFVGEINILPARIMSVPGEGIYIADISGRRFTLRTSRPFAAGDRVNVLLRPEDIRVYAHDDERPEGPYLTGRIEETVYKGATVDISIALDSGETLSVAEFFNEDDAEISYNRGERVAVTWVDGWEVVLPYEAD